MGASPVAIAFFNATTPCVVAVPATSTFSLIVIPDDEWDAPRGALSKLV
ncbi:MAG: hypothetical protein K0S65_959 [Labilithrix sp.]|nr:hypothetical protein [Labilithrix sp.]